MNSKILVSVALIAISLGLYGLAGNLTRPEVEAKKPEKRIKIWLARQAVSKGEMLQRSDIEIRKVKQTVAYGYGIRGDINLKFTPGMVSLEAINAGQAITPDLIILPDQAGYLEHIIKPGHVPSGIEVDWDTVIAGDIHPGSLIDVIALTSIDQNLASSKALHKFKRLNLSAILTGIKVLQIKEMVRQGKRAEVLPSKYSLMLELSQKQLARLTIAKRIAELEVHKSLTGSDSSLLKASAADVLAEYRAITEFRAGKTTLN
ncbi:MAG: Flp pilus assembly protein CpaB [Pseudomonadales bacterium]|nr:Flp pilus assembly protein CpaB [Pseudomonadales bacterium]